MNEEVEVTKLIKNFSRNYVDKPLHTELIRKVDKEIIEDVVVPVTEVLPRRINLMEEVPEMTEKVNHREVEYTVMKERPIPQEEIVELMVPTYNKIYSETELERPIKVLKIREEGVLVEKEVVVEIENVIERPVYEEVVEEVPVVIDTEVIEYYDVIKTNVIEVEKENVIEVVRKIRMQRPVERTDISQEVFGVDCHVEIPVEGEDIIEGDREI